MEDKAPYLTEAENQDTPWLERGETELAYYKRLYLEVTTENAELERDLDEARRLFDQVADVAFSALRDNYAFGTVLTTYRAGHETSTGEENETL